MRLTAAHTFLLTRLATATFYNGGKNGTGYFYQSPYGITGGPSDIPNLHPFEYGAANPNASNSVPISGFTWRTNVSEISVNDANTQPPNGTAVLNARVITSIFDLQWPGNDSIGVALEKRGIMAPYGCIMMIDGLGLAANVTSKYTATDNGTCTNVLGSDCVRDFLANISTSNATGCPEIPPVSALPASCAGTLGTAKTGLNGLSMDLTRVQGLPGGDPTSLRSGQGFAHILSSAFNGTNATAALEQAESRLQILVMKGLNTMACQKVNSTLTVAATPTPAGATSSATTSSAASTVERVSSYGLGLGMLAAVCLGL